MQTVSAPTGEILKARHQGQMFSNMSLAELNTAAQLIIADLTLLTGLKIPTGDAFKRMTELFAESLVKDYPFFTVPLMQMAIKKYCHVLTTGDNKSYGRNLSIADIHQVMNEYAGELQDANEEIDTVLITQAEGKLLSEEEKENVIRQSIQERYEHNQLDECTYADYNQLVKDRIISEDACRNNGWDALQRVKEKYNLIAQSVVTGDKDPESLRGIMEKSKYKEKLQMLGEIENEVKAEVANAYMQWAKQKNIAKIYTAA